MSFDEEKLLKERAEADRLEREQLERERVLEAEKVKKDIAQEAETVRRELELEVQEAIRRGEEKARQKKEEERLALAKNAPLEREKQDEPRVADAPEKPRVSATYLLPPSAKGGRVTSIATPPPPVYYVIIGCGTAAVVNHTTLRQTQWGTNDRIDKLPVMHIGFKDPWFHYVSHGMGQPPYLLTMPGYHQRPREFDVSDRNPGCRSDRFAAFTQNEWEELWKKYHKDDAQGGRFAWKEAWVAWIEAADKHPAKTTIKDKLKAEGLDLDAEKKAQVDKEIAKLDEDYVEKIPEARYRLLIVVPHDEKKITLEYVYAAKIDICTGAGRPRIPDGKAWEEGRTKLWTPPRMWSEATKRRKLVTGPEAFYTETIWNATDRVFINGGGGIGLNMAERAEMVDCYADWAPGTSLHNTFNLPRNDIVLKHVDGRQMKPGESLVREGPFLTPTKTSEVLTPAYAKWRFGGNSEPTIVSNGPGTDFVVIKINGSVDRANRLAPPRTPSIRDYYYQDKLTNGAGAFPLSETYAANFRELGLLDESRGGVYQRICLTTGLVATERGTSEEFAAAFQFDSLAGPGDGRTVGLQADGGRIRILGAAAQVHSSNKFKIGKPQQVQPEGDDAASNYFFTLPMSAVVPGFIFSGVNIAEANHYFGEGHPNINVNTMTMDELTESVGELIESPDWADLVDERDVRKIAGAVSKHRRMRNGYASPEELAKVLGEDRDVTAVDRWREIVGKILKTLNTDYPAARDFLDAR